MVSEDPGQGHLNGKLEAAGEFEVELPVPQVCQIRDGQHCGHDGRQVLVKEATPVEVFQFFHLRVTELLLLCYLWMSKYIYIRIFKNKLNKN